MCVRSVCALVCVSSMEDPHDQFMLRGHDMEVRG
jgi:hypothetical protein